MYEATGNTKLAMRRRNRSVEAWNLEIAESLSKYVGTNQGEKKKRTSTQMRKGKYDTERTKHIGVYESLESSLQKNSKK